MSQNSLAEPSNERSKTLAGYKISYAQNREDLIIASFFTDLEKGFYVDVGANDPVDDSVTKIFYDNGWNGLNIEPSPKLYAKLVKERPRDINVNLGASDKRSSLLFREYANHGLSTFSPDVKKSYEKDPSAKTSTYKDYEVKVLPTKDILKEHIQDRPINFMKIDVEGYEYSVLSGNDWKMYRPELICIEANHVLKDWHPMLAKEKYELVFDDGLNEYFLREESIYRKTLFDYAESLILSATIINPGTARRILQGDVNKAQLTHYIDEVNRLEGENARLKAQTHSLRSEISRTRSLKNLTQVIYAGVDGRILNMIDQRGYKRNSKKAKSQEKIDLSKLAASSNHKLLFTAKEYDVKAFFRYRTSKSTMKIRYRLANRTYVASRDAAKMSAKMSYRLLKKVK